jgi:hypothetical protein
LLRKIGWQWHHQLEYLSHWWANLSFPGMVDTVAELGGLNIHVWFTSKYVTVASGMCGALFPAFYNAGALWNFRELQSKPFLDVPCTLCLMPVIWWQNYSQPVLKIMFYSLILMAERAMSIAVFVFIGIHYENPRVYEHAHWTWVHNTRVSNKLIKECSLTHYLIVEPLCSANETPVMLH